jgi:hypothetical protein
MKFLQWLERIVFLGTVIRDYGILDDAQSGRYRLRTYALLCQRRGQTRLVFRTVATSPISAHASYAMVNATPVALARLATVARAAQLLLSEFQPHA